MRNSVTAALSGNPIAVMGAKRAKSRAAGCSRVRVKGQGMRCMCRNAKGQKRFAKNSRC